MGVYGFVAYWLLSNGYSILETGSIAAIYPAVWGISQLFAGKSGDHFV